MVARPYIQVVVPPAVLNFSLEEAKAEPFHQDLVVVSSMATETFVIVAPRRRRG